jgi:hypothetical protein
MNHSPDPHSQAAFFTFREETKSLETLSPEVQVGVLKHRLLVALERANDFQRRTRDLEAHLERLRTEQDVRAREHQEFAARSGRELATAQLLCRWLLQTLEQAAALDGPPAPPVHPPRWTFA